MTRHYPVLNEKDLRLIITLYEDDPEYFSDPDCPYSQEIKDLFTNGNQAGYFDSHTNFSELKSDDQILQEITDVYNKMKEYWEDVKTSEKGSDKNTFFRVSTTLLEKLVTMREKMSNIKKVDGFIDEVLSVMQEILTSDQRNEVMARLGKFSEE